MEYIRITKENIDKEHICCAMSGKQSLAKKEWLKQRSGEVHLIAQSAVTAANAYGRLSGGTCQNAFRLYMGRAAVTRERYKDTHLLARIHGGIREGAVFIEKQEKEIKKRSDK